VITIIMQAKDLHDGMTVRKPTGEKEYQLKKTLPVYGLGQIDIKVDPSIVFLVAQTGVNAIPDTTKLAMDFKSPYEAMQHLDSFRSHK
jgi:hypothetical protein